MSTSMSSLGQEAHDQLDAVSQLILSFVSILDSYGAESWEPRKITGVSAVIFLILQYQFARRHGIEWFAFFHALLSGVGSAMCVYLDINASEILTGIPEPLRSVSCLGGPLTSMHRIIPCITQGFAVCDIINGFRLGPEYLAHGVATFLVMGIFNEANMPQLVNTMLIMELSTIFLTVLKAEFFSPTMQLMSQVSFAIMFTISRVVAAPILWYQIISNMYNAVYVDGTSSECYQNYLFYTTFVFGMFFNCLNAFWFYKIIRMIRRKLITKEEKIGSIKLSEKDE